jgi:acyl-CoA synthetase (AMP-forming)/AMP-acid ligase II
MFLAGERLGDRLAFAHIAPGAVAPGLQLSYGELVGKARRIAAGLMAAGIKRGDRVALLLRPTPCMPLGLIATVLAGGVAAPVNTLFKRRELSAYLNLIEPAAVVFDESTIDMLREAAADLRRPPLLIAANDDLAADTTLTRLATAEPLELPSPGSGEPAVILHTSGTTGLSKGVVHTHGEYAAFVDTWSRGFVIEGDRTLSHMPLYHQAGLIVGWLATFGRALPFFQIERFSAGLYWEIVHRNAITWPAAWWGPPLHQLLELPPRPDDRRHPLRWVMASGTIEAWRRAEERFGVAAHSGYGSTETTMVTSSSPGERLTTRFDQSGLTPRAVTIPAGWSIPGFSELRVARADGSPTEPGEIGSLQVRGKAVFKRYFNDPERTAAAFTADGWFDPGDAAFLDERGCLHVLGRTREMIRRSGENIAPSEIEGVLRELPGIAEAAVVGVSDPVRGQELRACVVLNPGARVSAGEIFAHCRRELAFFKVPRYLEFCDALPKTQTFRVQKEKLIAAADPARWIDRNKLEGRRDL